MNAYHIPSPSPYLSIRFIIYCVTTTCLALAFSIPSPLAAASSSPSSLSSTLPHSLLPSISPSHAASLVFSSSHSRQPASSSSAASASATVTPPVRHAPFSISSSPSPLAAPTTASLHFSQLFSTSSTCGNGIIEGDEQCDCGTECTSDPCCDGSTCTFSLSVTVNNTLYIPECSALQSCCNSQTCQIVTDTTQICRSAVNDCDYAETCDGNNANCPSDLSKGNTWPCTDVSYNNAFGMCLSGNCTSIAGLCIQAGYPLGACEYSDYLVSPSDTKFCSLMQCRQSIDQCTYVTISGDQTTDISQTTSWADGTPCGSAINSITAFSGKQCNAGSCIDMNTIAEQFVWNYTSWEDCSSCGTPQIRSAQCNDLTAGTLATSAELCTEPTIVKTNLVRACNSMSLGCVYNYDQATRAKHRHEIYFFGVWLNVGVVFIIFFGIGAIWVVLTLCCCIFTSRANHVSSRRRPDAESTSQRLVQDEDTEGVAAAAAAAPEIGPDDDAHPQEYQRNGDLVDDGTDSDPDSYPEPHPTRSHSLSHHSRSRSRSYHYNDNPNPYAESEQPTAPAFPPHQDPTHPDFAPPEYQYY